MAPHNPSASPHRSAITHSTEEESHHHKAHTKPGKPFALFTTLPYYFFLLIEIFGFITALHYYQPYWVLCIVFLMVPLTDWLSHDWLNPDTNQYKQLENDILFKIPLFGQILVDNFLFFYALYLLSRGDFPLIYTFGVILIIGLQSGHHFLVAHEIFHKRGKIHRVFGVITMWKSLYMHFFIEHNYGHHKNVGTHEDPATSRKGESLYHFLPRTIIGSYRSAWNIEKRRMTKINGYKTHWVIQNKMVCFTLGYFLMMMFIYKVFHLKGFIIYLSMAIISVFTLETINYIEHYGLVRKEIAPGEYEKVNVTHSWNAPQRFSNYMLFKLQRHSDHHENSYKPYQVLSSKDESPMLPHGYMWCLIVSYFPSIWFRTMDRVLTAWKEARPLTKEEEFQNKKDSVIVFCILAFGISALSLLNSYEVGNWNKV